MTRFNLSSRDPDSWSAAVRRNFSVIVADGSIISVGLLSVIIASRDPAVMIGVGAARADVFPGSSGGCSWLFDIVAGLNTVVGVTLDVPKEEETRDGATVVGGEKNEPSSSVSRKSLGNQR